MISDTEDWSNSSFTIGVINYILKYIIIVILNCKNISQYYCLVYF